MPQVKFIAPTGKTDSVAGVGLPWTPGQVRNVTREVADRLLIYSDTWQEAEDKGVPDDTDANAPVGLAETARPVEEPLIDADFHSMTKDQMEEYAMRYHGVKIDKRKTSAEIRQQMYDLQSKKNTENAQDAEG